VLPAVDQDDRHAIGVLRSSVTVRIDIQLVVTETKFAREPPERDVGLLAEVAAGAGDQGDPVVRRRHAPTIRIPTDTKLSHVG
jgi:hypothetical protein